MVFIVLLKCRCRCPTCRTRGRFTRSREVDAAVAALPVGCPTVNRDDGGVQCRWTGTLANFKDHEHVFADQQQQLQPQVMTRETRARKRQRPDDDDDDDDAVSAVPPRKVKP